MGSLDTLLDLVYPPRCPFCGRVTPEGAPCPSCVEELSQIPPAEQALAGVAGSYGRLIVAYPYEGIVRRVVLRYKKLGQRQLDELLAAYLSVALRRQATDWAFDLVTAAPGNRRNVHTRGFDAGERIAQQAARLLGLPFYPLFTPHDGPSQKELTEAQRLHAAKGIHLKENAPDLTGLRILLVDDVVTTGATIATCGAALRQAGACEVMAAAVAITNKPQQEQAKLQRTAASPREETEKPQKIIRL